MLKNNYKWDESDIKKMTEYCVVIGVSASMTLQSREAFDEFVRTIFKTYPKEATVNIKNQLISN